MSRQQHNKVRQTCMVERGELSALDLLPYLDKARAGVCDAMRAIHMKVVKAYLKGILLQGEKGSKELDEVLGITLGEGRETLNEDDKDLLPADDAPPQSPPPGRIGGAAPALAIALAVAVDANRERNPPQGPRSQRKVARRSEIAFYSHTM